MNKQSSSDPKVSCHDTFISHFSIESRGLVIRYDIMKFYISTKGIKRLNRVSGGGYWQGMKGRGSPAIIRRISYRTLLLLLLLMMAIVLPFMFLRVAYLVLESSALCSSPLGMSFLLSFFF